MNNEDLNYNENDIEQKEINVFELRENDTKYNLHNQKSKFNCFFYKILPVTYLNSTKNYNVFLNSNHILIIKEEETKKRIDEIPLNSVAFKFRFTSIFNIEIKELKLLIKLFQTGLKDFHEIAIEFQAKCDIMIFKHFIEKFRLYQWQKFFESSLDLNKQIYQCHFFLRKINSRGKQQVRIMLLTDKFLFNIEYSEIKAKFEINENFEIKVDKYKWGAAIESFEEIKSDLKEGQNPMCQIIINPKINKKIVSEYKISNKSKNNIDFMFYSVYDYEMFIFQVKRLVYQLKKVNIKHTKMQ